MSTNITRLYGNLMRDGQVVSPRGMPTKELLGVQMRFDPRDWFISYNCLKVNYQYVKKELAWYLRGDKTDLSIAEHASIWNSCIEAGQIQSNYGFYFKEQLPYVLDCLKQNQDSRRAIININQLGHNYMFASDVPCTVYFNFLVRDNTLMLMVHMRSQDAVYGLRNDLPAFQMFKLIAAEKLGIAPGQLILTVDSFHVYSKHWNSLNNVITNNCASVHPGFVNRHLDFLTDAHCLLEWLEVPSDGIL